MSNIPFETEIGDSVPKVEHDVAVGEDLEFQRKWWRFERIVWPILLAIVVIDILGGFGRGWIANAKKTTPDKAMTLDYERIERASTPSVMTFQFSDAAVHNGRIILYMSDSVVKPLGATRIAPQPIMSSIGNGGITYVFPAGPAPAMVQIQLEPSFPGPHKFTVRAEGEPPMDATVFVMP
ncbi:hypothetical protein [Occallatibacter riparius]|uniref:Uncharacterized protein n=1 Tax=Occallatibacter riparius TaxID=1002689 RepID=A0A9J7BQR5_9BACT|nr:hypothetical protein [Occallatibacter riparius]UWZ83286.1 hypothetical protein MOP44_22285 [Occallatibacter riparius]